MTAVLASLFQGPLAFLADNLVLGDDARPFIPATALVEGADLTPLLVRFAGNYQKPEPIAVATLWSKWHFSILIPPVLAANIIADWGLPIGIGEIGVIPSEDGRTAALRLPHAGSRLTPSSVRERFAALVDGHLVPMVAAISRASALPQKVLWSNAGTIVEHSLGELEAFLDTGHAGIVQARTLLATRRWDDGTSNPLFEPVRYSAERGRRRRICCLRYRMDDLKLCKTCPLD
ncbi:siderophore-iron reductase FhuF [Labrys sp. WJW]|uniref:siderophore-iron reductase FhuF n=1 Tax=Labrys sp. WJW TaxID=1737983 RepID=UPI00082A510A|nr:siderophore-iron reductase FhuF [Labrys sp. WJW]OCC00560.1 siderophore-iron reductase FhuF [Labrys sp. WJW]